MNSGIDFADCCQRCQKFHKEGEGKVFWCNQWNVYVSPIAHCLKFTLSDEIKINDTPFWQGKQ
jgi:hypothetical protein